MWKRRDREMQNKQSHNNVCWIKIKRDTSGMIYPSPTPDHVAQGSSDERINLITSGYKPVVVSVGEETTALSGEPI